MSKDINRSKLIILENAKEYLSDVEYKELDEHLSQNDIGLKSFQSHGPKASLNDINIFISENITQLLIAGILMPVIYDVIKKSLKIVIYKIRDKVKIIQSGKIREAVPCLTFKTKNGEIKAPIPTDLSEEQFERYMDEIKSAMESIKINPKTRYESYVIEKSKNSLKVEAKTMLQYAHEQHQNQKKKKQ
ncbi:MAG: hypothetical protein FH762_01100 [Firmicutes bacterium]|nr:hypothetical protein [Bacillota bacterium]